MNDNGELSGHSRHTLREHFESLLCEGTVGVMVHAGPGLRLPDDVVLPCRLDYGYSQPRPPVDLVVTDAGIGATLSFVQVWHETFVPWGCVDGMGLVSRNPVEKPTRKLRAV